MQTRAVINKVRWIKEQLPEGLERALFGVDSPRGSEDFIALIMGASQFSERLSRDDTAIQVLRAFDLDPLVHPEQLRSWIQSLINPERMSTLDDDSDESRKKRVPRRDPVSIAWRVMTECVGPIERLTTPEEMQTQELPETFISFELLGTKQETSLTRLANATAYAEDAYEAVFRAYQIKGDGPLVVIKVESGSSIRIDCKGLGEPIKHLKDLILEAWHKLRHKRAEEVLENNKAVLGSLAVIEQINMRERDKSLSGEEAEQLRRRIVKSVCGLFESGALIAEIPAQEVVENTRLLNGFAPKRLAPPAEVKKATRKSTARKPRKRSPRNTPKRKPKP